MADGVLSVYPAQELLRSTACDHQGDVVRLLAVAEGLDPRQQGFEQSR
jgi:hypothetical protein